MKEADFFGKRSLHTYHFQSHLGATGWTFHGEQWHQKRHKEELMAQIMNTDFPHNRPN